MNKSSSPLVSVVVPCFNLGAYLDEAVQSVLDQTFQDFEIIIVDDGSDDPVTQSLFTSYRRPRTRIIRTDNQGLARARNLGLAEAKGKYVSFLDADDLFEPSFLERTVVTLESEPDAAFASCWLTAFGATSFDWTPESCSLPGLLVEDTVCTAALTRRDALVVVGGFDPEMPAPGYEDWDLAITLVERGYEGQIVPERLFRYRIRVGSMTEICTSAENHSRLLAYMVDKHASAYQLHSAAVVEDIRQRIASFEAVLENPPESPAVPDAGKWREGILALENHRRALQVLAYGADRPDGESLHVDLGTLGRSEPISRVWGLDRGTPIDRVYIGRFLDTHRGDIRGDVLEVKDDGYAREYGHGLKTTTVVDISSQNAGADLIADLSAPGTLPRGSYDCILLTQTLQFIYEFNEVVRNVHLALRPGGVALVTAPSVSRIDYESGVDGDFWRFTRASLRRLFAERFGNKNVDVVAFGNVLSCIGFLHGLAAEELPADQFEHHDAYFPLLICVRAIKQRSAAALEGYHDSATCRAIAGWVWDRDDAGRRVCVDISAGEEKLGTAWADRLRPDLAAAGLGDGRFGFVLPAPRDLHNLVGLPVRVTVAGTDWELSQSPCVLECVCGRFEEAVIDADVPAPTSPGPSARSGSAGSLQAGDPQLASVAWSRLFDSPGLRLASVVTDRSVGEPTLATFLSGTSLGVAVTVRPEADEAAGGLDPAAPSHEVAVWDLCIRMMTQGNATDAVVVTGDADLPTLAEQVPPDALRWLYRKHDGLYREHLSEVLLDREMRINPFLAENQHLEASIATSIAVQARGSRRERDRLAAKVRRLRAAFSDGHAGRDRWGDLDRLAPFSELWGADRGLCVDRYYIERFLEANTDDFRGAVLDVHDATYVRRYGGATVDRCDVLDIDLLNPNATVIADLRDAAGVSSSTYDCVILTQVLQLIDVVPAALREIHRILSPKGVALISVPCVSRVDPEAGFDRDYWRFSRVGLQSLLEDGFPGRSLELQACGNRVAVLGFLMGLAAEEVGEAALDQHDPEFPLVLTARVGPIS